MITFTFSRNVSSTEKFSFLVSFLVIVMPPHRYASLACQPCPYRQNAALNRPVAFPSIGPESGGTMVAVLGENLDIGSSRSVELEGIKCEILEDGVTR